MKCRLLEVVCARNHKALSQQIDRNRNKESRRRHLGRKGEKKQLWEEKALLAVLAVWSPWPPGRAGLVHASSGFPRVFRTSP